jgi:hypothetical protein
MRAAGTQSCLQAMMCLRDQWCEKGAGVGLGGCDRFLQSASTSTFLSCPLDGEGQGGWSRTGEARGGGSVAARRRPDHDHRCVGVSRQSVRCNAMLPERRHGCGSGSGGAPDCRAQCTCDGVCVPLAAAGGTARTDNRTDASARGGCAPKRHDADTWAAACRAVGCGCFGQRSASGSGWQHTRLASVQAKNRCRGRRRACHSETIPWRDGATRHLAGARS